MLTCTVSEITPALEPSSADLIEYVRTRDPNHRARAEYLTDDDRAERDSIRAELAGAGLL